MADADEYFVVRRVTRTDAASGLDWTDALWFPLPGWPDGVERDETREAREIEARFAEFTERLRPGAPAEAPADAEPVPVPTQQDRLDEARGLLARLDELRLAAATAVDQLANEATANGGG